MPRAQKEAKVSELAAQLSDAPAAVLAGYRGLTVQEAAELRTALAEVDTRFSVVKNSLAKLAAEQAGVAELVELIDGPTAVAFVRGDLVAAAKRLVEQARRFPVLEFRGGFAEGRILTGDDVKTLAALESREVMLARVAGLGKVHLSRTAFMFQALQVRLLALLEALRQKLPPVITEGPAPEAAAPAAEGEGKGEGEPTAPAEGGPAEEGESKPAGEERAAEEEPAGEEKEESAVLEETEGGT